jgi:hypothetical protein
MIDADGAHPEDGADLAGGQPARYQSELPLSNNQLVAAEWEMVVGAKVK